MIIAAVSVVILIFSAIGYVVFAFIYNNNYKLTDTGTEISPDGKYSVDFQMVGQPEWPFGATAVKVTVKETDRGEPLKVIDTFIHDDGAILGKGHWTVVWQRDTVEITLMGSEQEDELYAVQLR